MELLEHQATLHREAQPGGRLRSVKWYISSLTTHDFLLAAMLICLDLYHTAEDERGGRRSTSNPSSPMVPDLCDGGRREQMMQAVAHCITIWESVRDQSMEAFKASNMLRVMMENLKAHTEKHMKLKREGGGPPYAPTAPQQQTQVSPNNYPQRAPNPNYGMFPNGNVSNVNTDDLPPEQSAAMTLGMLSSGGVSPGPGFGMNMSAGPERTSSQPYPASMAALLNDPMTEQPRTGLTPQYAGPDPLNPGPASPMSQMMANAGMMNGFMGMDGADIDWVSRMIECARSFRKPILTAFTGRLGFLHPRH